MAWSPDEEVVTIITGQNSVVCLTQDFEIMSEHNLYVEGFGEQQPVSVGWGKAETQFRGTAGKLSGQSSAGTATNCPDDDGMARISWRGDGQFYATLVMHPLGYREMRVWSREGNLQSTGQMVDKLSHCLSWRPDGGLIAGVQQVDQRFDVVFFERNGLRHGEFSLPYKANEVVVREVEWNSDSSVLLVWVDSRDGTWSKVLLWTVGNYHWY